MVDFEDSPNEQIEIAAPGLAFDSGRIRVSSCYGGLTIYSAAIFKECRYADGLIRAENVWDCEHVMLARCMAGHGREMHLFPNLLVRASSTNLQGTKEQAVSTVAGGTATAARDAFVRVHRRSGDRTRLSQDPVSPH